MTHSRDGEALLAAIREAPGDDLARLAYADHLEETGREDRAGVIRWQLNPSAYFPFRPKPIRAREWFNYWWKGRWHGTFCFTTGRIWISAGASTQARRDQMVLDRGFVSTVRLPLAAWLAHGEALLAAHPLERVEATDKRPHVRLRNGQAGLWGSDHPDATHDDVLPLDVWESLGSSLPPEEPGDRWKWWPDQQAAVDALSSALLALAKPA
jgi:uncharacterized protein (TIGR02996 family)